MIHEKSYPENQHARKTNTAIASKRIDDSLFIESELWIKY